VRRLGWRNSKGCYDYFNFKMKSTQTVQVSRNNYSTMLGDFSNTMYSYDNFARGKRTRQTTAMLRETLNTDWISEEETTLLESLLMSTNVNIIENADTTYTVPVMITDTNFVRKTVANEGVKIQYTINIEYANPLNTNS
jgi:tRNA C32,U32 (ribose-2'-O)-methylase TrmJ